MKLRLTDADRALWGGEEWLEWDPDRLTVSEAEQLQELLGVDVGAYRGDWLRTGGAVAIKWALWLSLRRAGVTVDWAAFDPDLLGVAVMREPEPVVDEGKAPRRSTRPRRSATAGSS